MPSTRARKLHDARAWLVLGATPLVLVVTLVAVEVIAAIVGWGETNTPGWANATADGFALAAAIMPPAAAVVLGVHDWRRSRRRSPLVAALVAMALIVASVAGFATDPARGVG